MKTNAETRAALEMVNQAALDDLIKTLSSPGHPALVNEYGMRTELPAPVFQTLLKTVQLMREGRPFSLVPMDEAYTTQAAANYLGVSRQFLVNLLDRGDIPHHKVGAHRRVALKDLIAYERNRRQNRKESLDALRKRMVEAGVYDAEEDGGHAG